MNAQTISADAKILEATRERTHWRTLWWNGVLGGAMAAIGIHVILRVLGVGAGLATFSPITDDASVTHLKIGAAIVWSLCAVASLFLGATLAGRFSRLTPTGFVHGILVWSLSLSLTLLLLAKGPGTVFGSGLKMLSAGFRSGTEALVSNVGDAARDGFSHNR